MRLEVTKQEKFILKWEFNLGEVKNENLIKFNFCNHIYFLQKFC
jgi:hypothetical protein